MQTKLKTTMAVPRLFWFGLMVVFLPVSTVRGQSSQCTAPIYRILTVPLPGFVNVYTNFTGTYYSGFIIDVVYAVAKVAGFTFTITLGKDSDFGSTSGTAGGDPCFGGGVGQLQSQGFDIFAAALDNVLSYARVVDFTTPLFRSAIQVIYNSYTGLSKSNYLVINSTAGRDLLAASPDPRFQSIWQNIQQNAPTSLPNTYNEAIALVKQGGWALFGRTPAIDQAVCNSYGVIVKDSTVYKRTYASFGVQKGSNLLNRLNLAILQLQGDNTIDNLLYKWFPCSDFACS